MSVYIHGSALYRKLISFVIFEANGPPPAVPSHQHTGSESSTHSTSSATATGANEASTTAKADAEATGLENQVEALNV